MPRSVVFNKIKDLGPKRVKNPVVDDHGSSRTLLTVLPAPLIHVGLVHTNTQTHNRRSDESHRLYSPQEKRVGKIKGGLHPTIPWDNESFSEEDFRAELLISE